MGHVYEGTFTHGDWYQVICDGYPLDPKPSQEISNHSPDGFSWGYGGAGPAQLALAILLLEAEPTVARKHYMDFKREVIAKLDRDSFFLTSADVQEWLTSKQVA